MRRPASPFLGLLAAAALAFPVRAGDLADRLAGLGSSSQQAPVSPGDDLGSAVTVRAAIEPGAPGKPDVLAVTATMEPGWHIYSTTQKAGGPKPTVIRLDGDSPRGLAGAFRPDAEPHRHTVDEVPAWRGLVLEEHAGSVTWRAELAPAAGAAEVRGTVSLQLCRDNACLPPQAIAFAAVPSGSGGGTVTAAHSPERAHVTVTAALGPPRPGGGGIAWPLVVSLVPEADWHVYKPSGSATSGIGQGKPTIVAAPPTRDPAVVAARVGGVRVRPFATPTSAELLAAGAVEGAVELEMTLERPAGAEPALADVVVGLQTCSDTTCDPPTGVRIAVALPPDAGDASAEIAFEDVGYADAGRAPLAIDDPADEGAVAASPAGAKPALTLPLALLMGIAGGLILNLMPCVLPVLGLKLMSFAQQSGRERREVFEMNLWYCAGLFAVFFVLATASVAANIGLGSSNLAWGEQFTSVGFNITMVAVVFAFALSFLGVWELPIPGFIGEQAGHVQSREGPTGAFLKGVLSTVLATPCSGPFLGPVFGFTLSQSTAVTYAVFGAIATGMALPYIVVGLVPGLVRFLPRPGAWMETFKEVLGFVMLGTVAYLFTFLHHDWFVPTFALLVGIWAACWWVGRGQERLGADVGFGRWVQAATIAAAVGGGAFALLAPGRSLIDWEKPFTRARLAELRDRGSTVMVDFSADWCPTCKFNLATAIETTRVKRLIERNAVVPLLADWTDGSPEIKQMLESLDSKSIPVLAVFPAPTPGRPPPEPIVLRDVITEQQVLEALERAGPSRTPLPEMRAASTGGATTGR